MEDSKWQDSAAEWESAYRKVKADRDSLEAKLHKIREAAMTVQRGCDCEYDFRCGRCEALIGLKAKIFETKHEGA